MVTSISSSTPCTSTRDVLLLQQPIPAHQSWPRDAESLEASSDLACSRQGVLRPTIVVSSSCSNSAHSKKTRASLLAAP